LTFFFFFFFSPFGQTQKITRFRKRKVTPQRQKSRFQQGLPPPIRRGLGTRRVSPTETWRIRPSLVPSPPRSPLSRGGKLARIAARNSILGTPCTPCTPCTPDQWTPVSHLLLNFPFLLQIHSRKNHL